MKGLTMAATRTDENPHMENSREMDHWRCVLRYQGRRMTLVFSKGFGHNGAEPTAAEVMECLASDASGYSETFEDFCNEMGYDSDSRKTEKVYRQVGRQTEALKRLLGEDFETVVYAQREN